VRQKKSASSRKQRHCLGKSNRSGNDVGVPLGFPFNVVEKTRKVDDFYADVPCANFVADIEVCNPVLKECKCGGKVNESNHLFRRF